MTDEKTHAAPAAPVSLVNPTNVVGSATPEPKDTPSQTPSNVLSISASKPAPPAANDKDTSKQPPVPTSTPSGKPQAVAPTGASAASIAKAEQPAKLTQEERVGKLLDERYVRVDALADQSYFTHRGWCGKCGWQTMQHNEQAARELVRTHTWQHWRDVAAQAQVESVK